MPRRAPAQPRFVICISNRGYSASLVRRRLYREVFDPEAARLGMIRVIDESGDDYLYPARLFASIDLPLPVARALRRAG